MEVNDFSKAYDSAPHWAMRLTYRYYRMPPLFIDLLLGLDNGRFGSIITRDRLAEADSIATTGGVGYPQVPLITPHERCAHSFCIAVYPVRS